MTAKTNEPRVLAGDTELDCVTWVRSVRDAMYEATSKMSPDEFIAYVQRVARAVNAGVGVRPPTSGGRTA